MGKIILISREVSSPMVGYPAVLVHVHLYTSIVGDSRRNTPGMCVPLDSLCT